jgi:hypothetical protein
VTVRLPGVDDGKVFVLAPEQAALAVEQMAERGIDAAGRVWTLPGLPPDKMYVIDLDALNALDRLQALRVEGEAACRKLGWLEGS